MPKLPKFFGGARALDKAEKPLNEEIRYEQEEERQENMKKLDLKKEISAFFQKTQPDLTLPTDEIVAVVNTLMPNTQSYSQSMRLTKTSIGELEDKQLEQLKQKYETELVKTKLDIEKQYPPKLYKKCENVKFRDLQLMKALLPDVPLKELNKIPKDIPHLRYESDIPLEENKNPFLVSETPDLPNWERIDKMPPPAYSEMERQIIALVFTKIQDLQEPKDIEELGKTVAYLLQHQNELSTALHLVQEIILKRPEDLLQMCYKKLQEVVNRMSPDSKAKTPDDGKDKTPNNKIDPTTPSISEADVESIYPAINFDIQEQTIRQGNQVEIKEKDELIEIPKDDKVTVSQDVLTSITNEASKAKETLLATTSTPQEIQETNEHQIYGDKTPDIAAVLSKQTRN